MIVWTMDKRSYYICEVAGVSRGLVLRSTDGGGGGVWKYFMMQDYRNEACKCMRLATLDSEI